MTLLDDGPWEAFGYLAILGLAIGWGVRDVMLLTRALREARQGPVGPVLRDRIFGSIVGIAICVVGLVGLFRHHQGW